MRPVTALALGVGLFSLAACAGAPPRSVPVDFGQGPIALEGFAPCSDAPSSGVDLSSDDPLVVIVHGCFASGAQFRVMSELFELNGQRTICFNYDDRHSLRATGRTLRRGLDTIRRRAPSREITLLGHSQGGLISRVAIRRPCAGAGSNRYPISDSGFFCPSNRIDGVQNPRAGEITL